MAAPTIDLWAIDEVHFQQHGSRCRMWIPPEDIDPICLHEPANTSMKKTDGRKITSQALEEIRIRAIGRVQSGESPEIIIKTLGFARACIYNWLTRYRAGGWGGLKTGARFGRPHKL